MLKNFHKGFKISALCSVGRKPSQKTVMWVVGRVSVHTENARSTIIRPYFSINFHSSKLHFFKNHGARFACSEGYFYQNIWNLCFCLPISNVVKALNKNDWSIMTDVARTGVNNYNAKDFRDMIRVYLVTKAL